MKKQRMHSEHFHYVFSGEHALRYGDREAIVLQRFLLWIQHNKNAGKNIHDGRTWTYDTMETIQKELPFYTFAQIRRILKSLVEKGVLLQGNYNRHGYDRTLWYALKDERMLRSLHKKKASEEP